MSHTDDVIHQWGPPASQTRGCRFGDWRGRGRVGKVVGVEWNGRDNDRAVGFGNGSKWVSGEYESDI